MRTFITIVFIAFCNCCFCQKLKVDSVIDKGIYQSFFCFKLRVPLYVTYSLKNGGGPCDRQVKGFSFKDADCNFCAASADYRNSNYEKGHLANAEDFAFDCTKEELTFRYYNCVPQTTEANHGSWLKWESKIREISKEQKLFIVAGCVFGKKTIGENKVAVPKYCYKIVLNAKSKTIIHCLLFPNDRSKSVKEISLTDLKKKLNYDLMPASFWKKVNNE